MELCVPEQAPARAAGPTPRQVSLGRREGLTLPGIAYFSVFTAGSNGSACVLLSLAKPGPRLGSSFFVTGSCRFPVFAGPRASRGRWGVPASPHRRLCPIPQRGTGCVLSRGASAHGARLGTEGKTVVKSESKHTSEAHCAA